MSADSTPVRDNASEFVKGVRARRRANGQPEKITDEGLYRVLDGILIGRESTADPDDRADRRRRAAKRSRDRVPYA